MRKINRRLLNEHVQAWVSIRTIWGTCQTADFSHLTQDLLHLNPRGESTDLYSVEIHEITILPGSEMVKF